MQEHLRLVDFNPTIDSPLTRFAYIILLRLLKTRGCTPRSQAPPKQTLRSALGAQFTKPQMPFLNIPRQRSQVKDPKRSKAKNPKPKIQSQRSRAKGPKPKIPSQRSRARDPSQRSKAQDPKPMMQSQRSQSSDPKPRISRQVALVSCDPPLATYTIQTAQSPGRSSVL